MSISGGTIHRNEGGVTGRRHSVERASSGSEINRRSFFLFTLLSFATLQFILAMPSRARADIPCDQALTEVDYEANTLPQDDPVAPWQVNEVGIVTQSVQNGVLVVDALTEGSFIGYNRPEADLVNASAYSIEARMWYTNLLIPPTQSTGTLSVRDGEKQVAIYFQDGIGNWIQLGVAGPQPWPSITLDFGQPHVYLIEVVRGQNVVVYVDGQEVFNVAYQDLPDAPPGDPGVGLTGFSGAESTFHCDYVYYAFCALPVIDSDGDGILDDGDYSGTVGDNPCTGDATQNCDDNCVDIPNPDQKDEDGDGIGDACEVPATMLYFGKVVDLSPELPPVAGPEGKITVENLTDSPDPFQPPDEQSHLHMDLQVLELPGLPSRQFEFKTKVTWEVQTLDPARTIVYERYLDQLGTEPIDLNWDGKDDAGKDVPAGIYIYRTKTELIRTKTKSGKTKVFDTVVSPYRFLSVYRPNPLKVLKDIQADYEDYVQQVEQGLVDDPGVLALVQAGLRPAVAVTTENNVLTQMTAPSLHVWVPTFSPSDPPLVIAEKFLDHFSGAIGIEPGAIDFVPRPVRDIAGTRVVVLRPYLGGSRILARDVVIHVDPDNHVSFYAGESLPPNIVSGSLAYTPTQIAAMNALHCQPQGVEEIWRKVAGGLSAGYTFHCGTEWIAADAGTGDIAYRQSNRLGYPADIMHLFREDWNWLADPLHLDWCYRMDRSNGWLDEEWSQQCFSDGYPWFFTNFGFGNPASWLIVRDVIQTTHDYWYDNFGCAGPACDDSLSLRAVLETTDTDNRFDLAEGMIHVYHDLTDEGATWQDYDDKWVFWHEAEHEKIFYSLGMLIGHYATGIDEGHAQVAESAIAADSLAGYELPDTKGYFRPPFFPEHLNKPWLSPTWDWFWYNDPDQDNPHHAYPIYNWFRWVTAYHDPVVFYGALHHMVVGNLIPLFDPQHIPWANAVLSQAIGLWRQYAPSLVSTSFWEDAVKWGHLLGFWSGPYVLPIQASLDSPAGAMIDAAGQRTLCLAYRLADLDPILNERIVVQCLLGSISWQPTILAETSKFSPGIFTACNGDAIAFWHSAGDLIKYVRIYGDAGLGNPGDISPVQTLSAGPAASNDPAGICFAGTDYFVYKVSGQNQIAFVDEASGATWLVDPPVFITLAPDIGVAAAAVDQGNCSYAGKRKVFLAVVDVTGEVYLLQVEENFVVIQYMANSYEVSLLPWVPTGLDTPSYTTSRTPGLAAVNMQPWGLPPVPWGTRPYRLYLAWRDPPTGTVMARTLELMYDDWVRFGLLGCRIPHWPEIERIWRGRRVPQAGIQSGAGPKLMGFTWWTDPQDPQYRAVWMSTRQAPEFAGNAYYSWKMVRKL